jgi:RNA polymerase sigma-70 factor (ECF subfamily)
MPEQPGMDGTKELEWMARCRAGEAAAWERFFDEFEGVVGRYVAQLIPDASLEDIEEVRQDTFLAAIRAVDSFAGRSRVQTWLLRIAGNKARDFRDRRLAAKRGGGQRPIPLESLGDGPGRAGERGWTDPKGGEGADAILMRMEAMEAMRRALDRLGEPCREMLELRYFGDLDYESIGQLVGVRTKTVSSRLSRCLDRLGNLMPMEPSVISAKSKSKAGGS